VYPLGPVSLDRPCHNQCWCEL